MLKTTLSLTLVVLSTLNAGYASGAAPGELSAVQLAEKTITFKHEYGAWFYCNDDGDIVRTDDAFVQISPNGFFSTKPSLEPSPRSGEHACNYVHSHLWEEDVEDGPSSKDLSISERFSIIRFGVVDRRGGWEYQAGEITEFCPWLPNFRSGLDSDCVTP